MVQTKSSNILFLVAKVQTKSANILFLVAKVQTKSANILFTSVTAMIRVSFKYNKEMEPQ